MKLSKASSCLALLSLAAALSIAAPAARAQQLASDNIEFYGMDDSGHIVLNASRLDTCLSSSTCFETFTHDTMLTLSGTAPAFAYDDGTACSPSVPIGVYGPTAVCNNGLTAYYGEPVGTCCYDNLYEYFATSTPQLIYSGSGLTGPLYMNSLGDIVVDNGDLDEWLAFGDLTETPEPPSLLLLATGLFAFVLLLPRQHV